MGSELIRVCGVGKMAYVNKDAARREFYFLPLALSMPDLCPGGRWEGLDVWQATRHFANRYDTGGRKMRIAWKKLEASGA
jgi:hypothetical protein